MENIVPDVPATDVQAAVARVTSLVGVLEGNAETLFGNLENVLLPETPSSGDGTVCRETPSYVPLARTMHNIADRLEALLARHRDIIDRLHN